VVKFKLGRRHPAPAGHDDEYGGGHVTIRWLGHGAQRCDCPERRQTDGATVEDGLVGNLSNLGLERASEAPGVR